MIENKTPTNQQPVKKENEKSKGAEVFLFFFKLIFGILTYVPLCFFVISFVQFFLTRVTTYEYLMIQTGRMALENVPVYPDRDSFLLALLVQFIIPTIVVLGVGLKTKTLKLVPVIFIPFSFNYTVAYIALFAVGFIIVVGFIFWVYGKMTTPTKTTATTYYCGKCNKKLSSAPRLGSHCPYCGSEFGSIETR